MTLLAYSLGPGNDNFMTLLIFDWKEMFLHRKNKDSMIVFCSKDTNRLCSHASISHTFDTSGILSVLYWMECHAVADSRGLWRAQIYFISCGLSECLEQIEVSKAWRHTGRSRIRHCCVWCSYLVCVFFKKCNEDHICGLLCYSECNKYIWKYYVTAAMSNK